MNCIRNFIDLKAAAVRVSLSERYKGWQIQTQADSWVQGLPWTDKFRSRQGNSNSRAESHPTSLLQLKKKNASCLLKIEGLGHRMLIQRIIKGDSEINNWIDMQITPPHTNTHTPHTHLLLVCMRQANSEVKQFSPLMQKQEVYFPVPWGRPSISPSSRVTKKVTPMAITSSYYTL